MQFEMESKFNGLEAFRGNFSYPLGIHAMTLWFIKNLFALCDETIIFTKSVRGGRLKI